MEKVLQMILVSLQNVFDKMMSIIPNLLGGLIVIIIGFALAKLISRLVFKFVSRPVIKSSFEKLTETMDLFSVNIKIDVLIQKVVYYMIALLTLLTATDVVGMDILSQLLSQLVQYIPKLLSAILMFVVGVYIASLIRTMIATAVKSMGIGPWRIMGNMVFYFLVVAISISALGQAGMDTHLITANITLLLGGFVLAFAVAYGFAARTILSSLLTSFYTKSQFQVGQVIEVDGVKGRIIQIANISVTLLVGEDEVIIPTHKLHVEKVVVYKES